jgi:hypothetical protein
MSIVLYRAMCKTEFQNSNPLSFVKRFKWFGTLEFVKNRVLDGKFNNSHVVSDKYSFLVKYEFSDCSEKYLNNVGNNEFMIDRRMLPFIKVLNFELVENI